MRVYINKLTFKTIIGILDFERVKKQRVVINLCFDYNFKNGNFIDYSEVVSFIKKRVKKSKFLLLEDAIKDLKYRLNQEFKIKNLKIKIEKPNILKNCIVSLED